MVERLGGTSAPALVLSRFVGREPGTFICSENAQDLPVLAELVGSGAVTPALDRTSH